MINTILNQAVSPVIMNLTRKQKWLYYFLGVFMLPAHFLLFMLFYWVHLHTLIQYLIIFFANNGHFNKYGFVYDDQIFFTLQVSLCALYIVLLFIFAIKGRKNKKYKFLFLGMLSGPLIILIVMTIAMATLGGPFIS
jgi:hypothetical protein